MHLLSSRWFKIGVSLGLFVLLLRSTNVSVFKERIADARLEWVACAFIGYLFSQVVSAYKWRVLARPLGFVQPLRAFVAYYFAGMFFNLFAPSTVAGDFGRGALLAGERKRLGPALQSVVADRVSGLVMLLWVSAFGVSFLDAATFPLRWRWGVIVATVGVTAGWWLVPRSLGYIAHINNNHIAHKARRFLETLVVPYRERPQVLMYACGLSFGFHFLQLGLQVLVAAALSLNVSAWYLIACIPLINILSGLPVSFGGLGVREGGYVLFLSFANVSNERALAFGLLWSAIVVGANALGGVALLLSPAARLPLREAKKMSDG